MPRTSRIACESSIYHITARGVGQQIIFEDDEDRTEFMRLVERRLPTDGVTVLAWCLMGNHFHLLVRGDLESISQAMRAVLSKYALDFNLRHGRTGHLFQGRFFSEPIKDNAQFLAALRYIHQNPAKAGLSKGCDYRWSSYGQYVNSDSGGLCDTGLALDMAESVEALAKFHETQDERPPIKDGVQVRRRISDEAAIALLNSRFGKNYAREAAALPKKERDAALAEMKAAGMSVRQIQRLTGIGFGIIAKAKA